MKRTIPPLSKTQAAIRRIRFLPEAPAGAHVRRWLEQPRRVVAVEETVGASASPPLESWPEQDSVFWVICVPPGDPLGDQLGNANWLTLPDSQVILTIERNDAKIHWRPGRAVIRGSAEGWDDALAALTEFAFYEGELRLLEKAIADREPQAQADVVFAYRIRNRDRHEWPRLGDMIEQLAGIRLTLARLGPCLYRGSRQMSSEARQIFARLAKRADAEDRLEALDERLEALEDLYEGATDRVADYRWYRNGHQLETTIILLLLLEAILMSLELAFRIVRE